VCVDEVVDWEKRYKVKKEKRGKEWKRDNQVQSIREVSRE